MKERIGVIAKTAAILALQIIDRNVIKRAFAFSPQLQAVFNWFTSFLIEVVKVYTDKDPANKDQLKALWYAQNPALVDSLLVLGLEEADKIKDPALKENTIWASKPVGDLMKALLDTNPENQKQIKAILEANAGQLEDRSLDMIILLVQNKVKNEDVKLLIVSLLEGLKDADILEGVQSK